jgi:RNA polymerase sigma factor for flagellar operon FliA
MTNLPPDQLFLSHLSFIEQVATYACRQKGFSREATQDFVSKVKEKLWDNDYAVIRKFQGKSSFKTYLTVVINHLFQDHLNHLWGKWRSSAEAKRLGPLAIQLEKLMSRDGLSFHEACETLWTNHHVKATRQELEAIAKKLPDRPPTPPGGNEESLKDQPSPEPKPDERIEAQQRAARRLEVLGILSDALMQLPEEDVVLVKMSCEHKVADIARILKIAQKPLYPRLDKILNALRRELERRGVRADEIRGLLDGPEDEGPRH